MLDLRLLLRGPSEHVPTPAPTTPMQPTYMITPAPLALAWPDCDLGGVSR